MDFGNALNALRAGHKVARVTDGLQRVLWMERPDEISAKEGVENWHCYDQEYDNIIGDILATDWEIVDG